MPHIVKDGIFAPVKAAGGETAIVVAKMKGTAPRVLTASVSRDRKLWPYAPATKDAGSLTRAEPRTMAE